MRGSVRNRSCARTAAVSLLRRVAAGGTPDTLRAVTIFQAKSRIVMCCRCMCRHRLGCRGNRFVAGPLVLDRCSHSCRCLLRLRIGREKVDVGLLRRPRDLRDLYWRRTIGSGEVWLAVEWVRLWESGEVVKGLGWTLEGRIGMERSSWPWLGLVV